MFTDKDYFVKDRFRDISEVGSVRTLYRSFSGAHVDNKDSLADPSLYPEISLSAIKTVTNCPPGLEILAALTKVYFIRRLDITADDPLGTYKGEIINEEGDRIFLLTNSVHYDSDEIIEYEKHKKLKMKGKICYGVINYAGVQVFEIYGDPGKVIRVGPNSAVWGEIQMIPRPVCDWFSFIFYCCTRFKKRHEDNSKEEETEIQVIVLKKDYGEKRGPYHQHAPVFKHVYTLRGRVSSSGYCCPYHESMVHKKNFELRIYSSPSQQNEVSQANANATTTNNAANGKGNGSLNSREKVNKRISFVSTKKRKVAPRPIYIGRLGSDEFHEKLNVYLPILEIPESMNIYDKITLMGTFFLFSLI